MAWAVAQRRAAPSDSDAFLMFSLSIPRGAASAGRRRGTCSGTRRGRPMIECEPATAGGPIHWCLPTHRRRRSLALGHPVPTEQLDATHPGMARSVPWAGCLGGNRTGMAGSGPGGRTPRRTAAPACTERGPHGGRRPGRQPTATAGIERISSLAGFSPARSRRQSGGPLLERRRRGRSSDRALFGKRRKRSAPRRASHLRRASSGSRALSSAGRSCSPVASRRRPSGRRT